MLSVGMWTDNSVRLLTLPTLQEITRVHLGVDTQARDILSVSLGDIDYLLVGLGDGTLITFTLNLATTDGLPSLSGRRKIVLGTHPISFTAFRNAATLCVFATCDRPTVIYSHYGKLLFSMVNVSEVAGMTPFHSEMFPDCIALSSDTGLLIGVINDIQKIHIQSFPLGEMPKRIVHCPTRNLYVVTTEKVSMTPGGEVSESRVLFIDDGTFEVVASQGLDYTEQGLCLTTISCGSDGAERVAVGTAYINPAEDEPTKGRILIFDIDADRRITQVVDESTNQTKGAVMCLSTLQSGSINKLVAGIGSKVAIYNIEAGDVGGSMKLVVECIHHGFIVTVNIRVRGDLILVGDILKSVTLLQYKPPSQDEMESTDTSAPSSSTQQGTLVEVARDFSSHTMRGLEFWDEDLILFTEDFGNIFVMRRQLDASTDEERAKLLARAEFHVGDYINVFRKGSLDSQPGEGETGGGAVASPMSGMDNDMAGTTTASIIGSSFSSNSGNDGNNNNSNKDSGAKSKTGLPENVLFGTLNGAIGSLIPLDEEGFRFFSTVEKCMKTIVAPVGQLSHEAWRSYATTSRSGPSRNVVDGDVVERLLELNAKDLAAVVALINEEWVDVSPISETGGAGVGALVNDLTRDKLSVDAIVHRVEEMTRWH